MTSPACEMVGASTRGLCKNFIGIGFLCTFLRAVTAVSKKVAHQHFHSRRTSAQIAQEPELHLQLVAIAPAQQFAIQLDVAQRFRRSWLAEKANCSKSWFTRLISASAACVP